MALLGMDVVPVKIDGLPDPLHAIDGTPVTSLSEWTDFRRDEIRELFQYYVYGYYPDTPELVFTTITEDPDALLGIASYREIEITFNRDDQFLDQVMTLAMFLPTGVERPPVFITINRCGNHSLHHYEGISFPTGGRVICSDTNENKRGRMVNFWSIEKILNRGYAVVSFLDDELDRGGQYPDDDIHAALLDSSIANAPGPEAAWGMIAAWSWGFSRAIDYLDTIDDIDTDRIAIIGHSRRAKAAFLAGAFDDRIALTVSQQGGTGAEALNRGSFLQEPVFLMNRMYPTWFNSVYQSFNFRIRSLPIDQHQLMALIAPRAFVVTAASDYLWAGPRSSFRAMEAINPVYDLYGLDGVVGIKPLSPETLDLPIGQLVQIKDKGHHLSPVWWDSILAIADRYLMTPDGPG